MQNQQAAIASQDPVQSMSPLYLADCLEITDEAKFLCEAQPPYRVVFANRKWTEMTGYHQHDVVGGNLNCLQGPMTSKHRVLRMIDQLRSKGHCEREILINYTKTNEPICCELRVRPVLVDSDPDLPLGHKQHVGYFLTTVQQHPMTVGLNLFQLTLQEEDARDTRLPSSAESSSKSMSALSDSNYSGSSSARSHRSCSNSHSSGDDEDEETSASQSQFPTQSPSRTTSASEHHRSQRSAAANSTVFDSGRRPSSASSSSNEPNQPPSEPRSSPPATHHISHMHYSHQQR